ncbi:hypothetical protein HDU86_001291 [Geranomyces michiganensis]|nr:hypothetical protein HDU86_001291 [Geranomyces michiganensis]
MPTSDHHPLSQTHPLTVQTDLGVDNGHVQMLEDRIRRYEQYIAQLQQDRHFMLCAKKPPLRSAPTLGQDMPTLTCLPSPAELTSMIDDSYVPPQHLYAANTSVGSTEAVSGSPPTTLDGWGMYPPYDLSAVPNEEPDLPSSSISECSSRSSSHLLAESFGGGNESGHVSPNDDYRVAAGASAAGAPIPFAPASHITNVIVEALSRQSSTFVDAGALLPSVIVIHLGR